MSPQNPYLVAGTAPALRKSVVAFLDILGFVDEMKEAFKTKTAAQLLIRLRSAMDTAYENFSDEIPGFDPVEINSWHVKAFTDNIVIGYPITHSDAEGELGSLLLEVREYQVAMVNSGFFVRGGIAIGDAYLDNEIVFGDALLDAYNAESTLARDPRIVLADSVRPYVDRHFRFYGNPAESPHNDVLLKDVDGQLFVNYLGTLFDEEPDAPRYGELQKHKAVVEAKLRQYKNQPSLWSKYAWSARYHNFICHEQRGRFLSYVIDPDLMQTMPTRIIRG
jgi:hypothetical protein